MPIKSSLSRDIFPVGKLSLVLTPDVTRVESLFLVFPWVNLTKKKTTKGFQIAKLIISSGLAFR
jgi:hypothetical protein